MSMAQIDDLYPLYYDRVNATVPHVRGNVLEVGCGNGNITRWIAIKSDVTSIHAFDISSIAIDELRSYGFVGHEKIHCECCSMSAFSPKNETIFDTIVLSEVIEHVALDDELNFLKKIKKNIVRNQYANDHTCGTKFVVSTPIGFMADPAHCRGFSKRAFIKHVNKYYGKIRGICYTGCQQIAWGHFNYDN